MDAASGSPEVFALPNGRARGFHTLPVGFHNQIAGNLFTFCRINHFNLSSLSLQTEPKNGMRLVLYTPAPPASRLVNSA
jgi:hypothetical protein